MARLTTLKALRKVLMHRVFVAALIALIGFQSMRVAAQGQQLWTIMIRFEYQNGFEFDYVLERGVSTADLGADLAECGSSHVTGSGVRYHCYPVPE